MSERDADPDARLDVELLSRSSAGDEAASAAFDARHRARLERFCAGYLRQRDQAEDAASEVLLRLLRARPAPENPRAWLLRSARNHCLNLLRERAAPLEPLGSELELAASLTGQLTRMARAEEREALQRALASLSDEERELLRLRYGEDLSREELALVTGLPASLVKSRLHEALEKLRRAAPPPAS